MITNNEIELNIKQPLRELMQSCEIFCIAGCCGDGAFDISEEQISRWISASGQELSAVAANQLRELIAEVKMYQLKIASELFNARWQPAECVGWLTHWETTLGGAIKKTGKELINKNAGQISIRENVPDFKCFFGA